MGRRGLAAGIMTRRRRACLLRLGNDLRIDGSRIFVYRQHGAFRWRDHVGVCPASLTYESVFSFNDIHRGYHASFLPTLSFAWCSKIGGGEKCQRFD